MDKEGRRKQWSAEEDAYLLQYVSMYGDKWVQVAMEFEIQFGVCRTNDAVRNRWNRITGRK